ncbi:response regulator [Pseudodonghicola xiamenensis]|uniref:Response regulator n=1 Tax=Pseudodonghicola xiamenensis TaxID=337702 RepID=A0A8J3MDY5_9RHOB|nr:response regulator [Pseudodonghicola xiamenensis]GHH01609.1 response regulator [Pseudodonghicola xiamenensis]
MDDTDLFGAGGSHGPGRRPLLGLTVLVVEDSNFAAEALRLLCLRSGARIRRADSLKSARLHLQAYRPSVLIVDLGLPDGSGADLIEEMASARPRISAILGLSGDSFSEDFSIAAGADGFLPKPLSSLADFQTMILRRLPVDLLGAPPSVGEDEIIHPDPIAFRDDMAHVADILTETHDGRVLDYVAQFLRGVARSAADDDLAEAAAELAQIRRDGAPVGAMAARIAGLVQQRMQGDHLL